MQVNLHRLHVQLPLEKKELKCYISPASVSFLSEVSVSLHVILGVCIF